MSASGYMDIHINAQAIKGLAQMPNVYLTMIAQVVPANTANPVLQATFKIDPKTGIATPQTNPHVTNTIKLSSLTSQTIRISDKYNLTGGRIYFSSVDNAVTINGTTPVGPTASTAKFYYDFVEFAYNGPKNQFVIDTSQVDQVGFPISIQTTPVDHGAPNGAGILLDRATLFENYLDTVPTSYDHTVIPASGGNNYRILNPSLYINGLFNKVVSLPTVLTSASAGKNADGYWTATAKIALPNTTNGLSVGQAVRGPYLAGGAVILSKNADTHTITLGSKDGPFDYKASAPARPFNYLTPPTDSLVTAFDARIEDFFNKAKATPIVVQGVDLATYTGKTITISGTNINGTSSNYTVLRFTNNANASQHYDIYMPFFTTNTLHGKTPSGIAAPPPPSWFNFGAVPSAGNLNIYEPATQMVLACDGVFGDAQFRTELNAFQKGVLANLQNQVVTGLNRGYASTFQTRTGSIDLVQPTPTTTATVHFTSGSTADGLHVGMKVLTLGLSQALTVSAIAADKKSVTLSSPIPIKPLAPGPIIFADFYPAGIVQNEYSSFLHDSQISKQGLAYAFAFDDQGGYSTTLTSNNASSASVVLLPWTTRKTLNDAPIIGALRSEAPSYNKGQTATVTALNVVDLDSQIASVSFYFDKNANGKIDASDTLISKDTNASDGWSASVDTSKFSYGYNTILAIAADDGPSDGENLNTSAVASTSVVISGTASTGKPLTYIDDKRQKVTVAISTGEVKFDNTVEGIIYTASPARANAQVTVTVAGAAGATTDIAQFLLLPHSGASLASLNAPGVNITQGWDIDSPMTQITLAGISGADSVDFAGGTGATPLQIKIGQLAIPTVHLKNNVSLFSIGGFSGFANDITPFISIQNTLANFTVKGDFTGRIEAPSITAISISGAVRDSQWIVGQVKTAVFSGKMDNVEIVSTNMTRLSGGAANKVSLTLTDSKATTLLAFTGAVTDSAFDVAGSVSTLRAKSFDSKVNIDIDGKLQSLSTTQRGNLDGAFSAGSINAIVVTGNFMADLCADTVGSMNVYGSMIASRISVRVMHMLSVNEMLDSLVTAGASVNVQLTNFYDTPAPITDNSSFIGNVVIRSPGSASAPTFVNSIIAAEKLGHILLKTIDPANNGHAFGIAAVTSITRVLATGLPTRFNLTPVSPDTHLTDFTIRMLD